MTVFVPRVTKFIFITGTQFNDSIRRLSLLPVTDSVFQAHRDFRACNSSRGGDASIAVK
jgi:hypothetical protein